ncbi:MAG: hypothetical protein E3J64_00170 [Anaerolineales bacterium]|nr:MAG: hypothetical protein E3J64_00170 [Anaerolineales bacterium]
MTRRNRRKDREQERLDRLLSAYMDGQMADPERSRLEVRLGEDAALRAELEALRHTVRLLGELPTVAVPRNFILPRETTARAQAASRPIARRPLFAPVLTAATSLATLLFGIVLTGELILSQMGGAAMAPAPAWSDTDSQQTLDGTPVPGADGEGLNGLVAPPDALATATPSDGQGDERFSVDDVDPGTPMLLPAASAEPVGGGGEQSPGTPTATPPMAEQGEEPESEATPTVAAVGEAPAVEELDDEAAGKVFGAENQAAELAPPWLWHTIEACLGLGAVLLGGATVWAWRARRR